MAKALWSMGAGLSSFSVHPYEGIKGIVEHTEISVNPSLLLVDPSASEKVGKLAKGVGENYIEASGHKLNPQTGAIEAGGKTRWGEVPGLLAVDVGSFLIPGAGEAKAVGEVVDAAGAISKVGDGEKGLQAGAEGTKAADTAKELAEGEKGVGEVAKECRFDNLPVLSFGPGWPAAKRQRAPVCNRREDRGTLTLYRRPTKAAPVPEVGNLSNR